MSRKSFILATAGHVDHGKSGLVRALTGGAPDRLPAEQARGVTIELGFTHLALDDADVGVIDVPGHEDFVKNMVAGVGAIDVALLVVAADDGWMPQTEEHLQILAYLGVTRAVVALTKIDLVGDGTAAEAAIRRSLLGSTFADAPIVRTSTKAGVGLNALRDELARTLAAATPRADVGKPRLSVDRAFTLHGVGTVVTGTLIGGSICRGDDLLVRPAGTRTRVRFIQSHGRDRACASPGSRVALNLPDTKVGESVRRGDVVTSPRAGIVTARLDVSLERSARHADTPALSNGVRVIVHHGAATTFGTLRSFDGSPIVAGAQTLARLSLERPIFVLVGDRLLLRDSGQRATLAGATVLDASPPVRRRATASAQATLLSARQVNRSVATVVASQVERDGLVPIAAIDETTDATTADVLAAVEDGVRRGLWRRVGERIASTAVWRAAAEAIVRGVDAHHAAHPEHVGASITGLRGDLDTPLADAVIADLTLGDMERVGGLVRRRTHQTALPPRLQPIGDAIRRQLDARPFDPPSRKEIAKDDASIQALRFLIANASVIEVGTDIVMTDAAYRAAAAKVRGWLSTVEGGTVSELKQLLGSSRRVMVPLLERFDLEGVTRRVDDLRVLGTPAT